MIAWILRRTSHVSAAVASCGLAAAGACGAHPDAVAHAVVRDSLGIRIVDNRAVADSQEWRLALEPVFRIAASESTEDRPLDPRSVYAVPGQRVVVSDGGPVGRQSVFAYGLDGKLAFRVGRRGQGPGEFRDLRWVWPYRADSMAALDAGRNQILILDQRGELGRYVSIPAEAWVEPREGALRAIPFFERPLPDGGFLASSGMVADPPPAEGPFWVRSAWFLSGPEANAWASIGALALVEQYASAGRGTRLPFAAAGFVVPHPSGVVVGTGDRAEFTVRDRDGRIRIVARFPDQARAVGQRDTEAYIDWRIEKLRRSPEWTEPLLQRRRLDLEAGWFPERTPHYSNLLVDDVGNIWLEGFRLGTPTELGPGVAPVRWLVFSPEGLWLRSVEVPARFLVFSISENTVYGFAFDEFDVPEVLGLGLQRTDPSPPQEPAPEPGAR